MKAIYKYTIALLVFCASENLWAQNASMQGILTDTLHEPLINATVVLLNPQDSVMENFSITNVNGKFQIKNIKAGEYIFQASYLGHQTMYQNMTIEEGKDLNLGALILQPEDYSLGEVTVSGERIPIQIKKDTIEYNAGSFRVQPNDNVEKLLKKLPGVEVDQNGTIKAQGKEVQNIMVDGKEFFGKDPKVASQNLPADVVDKVQVYDKKSDIAEFTGVDDGSREKTINLKLKEDKKNGVFGNVAAGYGTENRFETRATVNQFSDKKQISFLGRANNINEQGFSFNDYLNFSGGLQNLLAQSGTGNGGDGFSLSFGGDDAPIPFDSGQPNYGFQKSYAGGLNFNYDFSKSTELRTSYFFNKIQEEQSQEIFRQNFLEDAIFPSEENGERESDYNNHRANLTFKHKVDSTQVITLRANARLNYDFNNSKGSSRIFNVGNELENTSWNTNDAINDLFQINSGLSYMLRLKKKGRSVTANAGYGWKLTEQNETIMSANQFFLSNPQMTFFDSLHQDQEEYSERNEFSLGLTYTEPLGKRQFLQFSYSRRTYKDYFERDAFDFENASRILNADLTDGYVRDYAYDRLGLSYRWAKRKTNLRVGVNWQNVLMEGNVFSNEKIFKQNFNKILPSMNWRYEFSNSNNLSLNYWTNIQEPSLRQLQPILNNNNPISLYLGNPDLIPEYQHSMNLDYFFYDQFNFISLFASLRGTYTLDKITNARTIDDAFRQTTQPINVEDDKMLSGNISYGMPLKFIKSKFNLSLRGTYNRSILFVNDIKNDADRWNGSIDFSIENRKKDIVDILLGTVYSYNETQYSINQNFDQSFSTLTYYADLTLNLKKDWAITTSFDQMIYRGEAFQEQRQIPMWEASISKYFLKNKRGQLELSARDLFNQGIGINRNSNLNYIEDIQINSLGRYYMLTFTYALSMFGEPKGGIEIREGRRRRG